MVPTKIIYLGYYSEVSQTNSDTPTTNRLYQTNFPLFTISASIGNAATLPYMPEKGQPLENENIMEILYLYHANGHEEIIHKYKK